MLQAAITIKHIQNISYASEINSTVGLLRKKSPDMYSGNSDSCEMEVGENKGRVERVASMASATLRLIASP